MSKAILQKAATSTYHPSRLQMDSSGLDPHLMHGFLNHKSQPPNGISIGSAGFSQLTRVQSTETNTHRQTHRPCCVQNM